ncbi:MAG TPA: polysaccharide biosynthesis C-terminal domain-containing protein, partial [Vicinamibacterales bacterium]|nr:polysaccharide biosynthesis C-terminal domain-containing protein [Vicinamibacterales bacterium]
AAVYGIASRPAISLCGGIETTLRPLYFHAVSNNNAAAMRRTVIAWFGMVATIAVAIFLLFLFFSDVIAYWCLGEQYRGGAALMPWIAAGYSLSAVSHVFSGVAYAQHHTHHVLLAQLTGAIASVLLGVVGVYLFGIEGAAAAVSVALGLQLLVAAVLARKQAAS